jgi:transcriptional regulator with XRE-family HTH domain
LPSAAVFATCAGALNVTETIAARIDLSIGFLQPIERGLSSPSLRVLPRLRRAGVGIAALFGSRPSGERGFRRGNAKSAR